ncbi:KilA-N domain-containing protein [Paludibacter sp.]
MAKISVKDTDITIIQIKDSDFISLTDIARHRDSERSDYILQNWMRNRSTIEFLGLWEYFNNPNFNYIEFDGIKNSSGANSFSLTPKRWIESTNAIGVISKTGRYGGTYAHRDIAFEFASWLSSEFKFYLIKEFQRLKEEEQMQIGWSAKRELAKINYAIHTDAIKRNLIPEELTSLQTSIIYANGADVLNVALFGMTDKQWRELNQDLKGNMRDYASINELICLSNLENLNAHFINEGYSQKDRLIKLNQIAIQQMRLLLDISNKKILK